MKPLLTTLSTSLIIALNGCSAVKDNQPQETTVEQGNKTPARTQPADTPAPKAEAQKADHISMTLAQFNTPDAPAVQWRTVNDNVMGGRSLGTREVRSDRLVFSGSLNTNGGGFSSVRAYEVSADLSTFSGLLLKVRADSRTYTMQIYTGLRYARGNVSYNATFQTEPLIDANGAPTSTSEEQEEWQEVYVSFDEFVPRVRGRRLTGIVEPLDPAKVQGIGLMLADGVDGPFRLEIQHITAVAQPNS